MKDSKINFFITGSAVLILLLLVFQLATLSLYPIPWFDDTLFASIAKDVMDRGKFFPFIAPFGYQFHECLTYGPVFFISMVASFKIFGFGIFASRFVGYFFGVIACYLFVKIYTWNRKPDWTAWLLALAFLFDYTIFDGFHSGRMEFVAILFLYGYTYFHFNK